VNSGIYLNCQVAVIDHGNNRSNWVNLPSFAAGVNGSVVCFDPALTVSVDECLSVISLYNSTSGNGWTTKTNWLANPDVDSWYGIVVTNV